MPDGYLYRRIMRELERLIKEGEKERKELIKEMARSFRLTRKDILKVLKELERENVVKIKKRRVIFVGRRPGRTNIMGVMVWLRKRLIGKR